MRLTRMGGPECPLCGCSDTVVVRRITQYSRDREKRVCMFCNRTFFTAAETAPLDAKEREADRRPAVIYHPVRCPECGSVDTVVTSTRSPIRHHKCRNPDCNARFKSCEE